MTIVSEHDVSTRRNTELLLIVLAVVVSASAYFMVDVGVAPKQPAPTMDALRFAGMVFAPVFVLHLVVRKWAAYADPVVIPIATLLSGIGIMMIHRVDLGYAADGATRMPTDQGDKQALYLIVSVLICAVTLFALKHHQALRGYTYTAMLVSIVLLLLPLVPGLGRELNGARIWIGLGPIRAQPAEFTKITLTIFFAGYLVSNRDQLALAGKKFLGLRLPRARDLGPLLVVWTVSIGVLVLQRDLGTSLLLFGLFVAMLYIATERGNWVTIAITLFASGCVVAWKVVARVKSRVTGWLDTFDPEVFNDAGNQVGIGIFGMANGGMVGTGLGAGTPHKTYAAASDQIFSSLGEEMGLVGTLAILLLFMILVERAFRTAIGVRDGFGKLLASGLGFVVALQLFVVVGGVTRVLPLTGLTLPLVAAGGSSLVANWVIVALLLRISHAARKPTPISGPKYVTEDGSTAAIDVKAMQAAIAEATAPDVPPAAAGKRGDGSDLAVTADHDSVPNSSAMPTAGQGPDSGDDTNPTPTKEG